MVYIILGNGFEETEAVAPFDILHRGGVKVQFASVGDKAVSGAHGIVITAYCSVSDIDLTNTEMLVIPGGLGGVESIESSEETMSLFAHAHEKGVELAAICAGPRVLARLGIMVGKAAVCYPGMEKQITGADMQMGVTTARAQGVTTGLAPGAAIDFGLHLLEVLRGKDTADAVAGELCYGR